MSFEPVRRLRIVLELGGASGSREVGTLARTQRGLLFEYAREFLDSKLQLSPYRLPLRRGVVRGDPLVFDGLPGVFEDSLPDGWGRLLLDRLARREGVEPAQLGPLDRLAWVGDSGLGALQYFPTFATKAPSVVRLGTLERETRKVLADRPADLDTLFALGGSPQGARPKVLLQRRDRDGALRREAGPEAGWTSWLVKFRAKDDPVESALVEHLWMTLAAECGVRTAETTLLEPNRRGGGFLAVRRFDREGPRRLHLHTLSGLLHVPPGVPALDARHLLDVTGRLTRDEQEVRHAFRLVCFNVLAHNHDDHPRNVSFLLGHAGHWRLAPAYDLTPSHGPGSEHAMAVCGVGLPGRAELLRLGDEFGVAHARRVLDEVEGGLARLPHLAKRLGVPARVLARLAALVQGAGRRR